jgi:ubiquinone/menaquinone biosynthesis C-methylase UbiE
VIELFALLALGAILAAVIYWQVVIAEGAHLGPRVVVALYNRVARRYDRLKKFDAEVEAATLGWPLAAALAHVEQARVLDVGAGTGRLARALLAQVAFDGQVVNLDLAEQMLRCGLPGCQPWPGRVSWVVAPAAALPFPSATFDAVTSLEALEFLPSPAAALAECVRVLRPGGRLLVTHRVGQAWLLPGKTTSRPAFARALASLGLDRVRAERWQVDYDLVWATKPVPPGS